VSNIIGSAQFEKNFAVFAKGQLGPDFNWNNVLMIGGGVGACLLAIPDEFKGNGSLTLTSLNNTSGIFSEIYRLVMQVVKRSITVAVSGPPLTLICAFMD
jgi:hypothetical protein